MLYRYSTMIFFSSSGFLWRWLFLVACVFDSQHDVKIEAYHQTIQIPTRVGVVGSSKSTGELVPPLIHSQQGVTATTMLQAKNNPVEPEPERQKKDGLWLFLLYMTPWKNPNSIFVYMLMVLYFLGKYSEAQSAARIASGL